MHSRREAIKEMLTSAEFVNVGQLTNQFQVSSETIRRDLAQLEKAGFVKRIHGGAVRLHPQANESAYQMRSASHVSEKHAIAQLAASLIDDGDTVLITPGTSTREVASLLRSKQNLTVITNSLPVAMNLADCPSIQVCCLGGVVRGVDFSTAGMMAVENLSTFNASKLILGIGGIAPHYGLTDFRMEESVLLRGFVNKVNCVIGIADHSKFGVVSVYNICPADRLNYLITDSGTPSALYQPYQEMGVRVLVASAQPESAPAGV